MGEHPTQDRHEIFAERLSLLASGNDHVYRAAFREYITDADIKSFLSSTASRVTLPGHSLTVFRGDVYAKRYMTVSELARSKYKTVWLAVDLRTYTTRTVPTCEQVAIKISRAKLHYSKGTRRQIQLRERILRALEDAHIPRSHSPLVRVFNHFHVAGLGGRQMCLVMERMNGSLLDLLQLAGGRRLPLNLVRRIACDALRALEFLHDRCGLVHTDLEPSNFLVTAGQETGLARDVYADRIEDEFSCPAEFRRPLPVVKIGNLGNATEIGAPCVLAPIRTMQYRAPEVLLGMHYSTNNDVWSLGCTLFELLTGAKLFDPKPDPGRNLDESGALLVEIYKLFGRLPEGLRQLPATSYLFDDNGDLRPLAGQQQQQRKDPPWSIRRLLHERHGYDRDEADELDDFLRPMLAIDPSERVQSAQHLQHPWLKSAL